MNIVEERKLGMPLFSICVPQYNRTSFLLKCLESFLTQTFQDFEVCISDGGSTDSRHCDILDVLRQSKMPFVWARSEQNLQYDPNLRSSISLARGRYCLLFGNDDMLSGLSALEKVAKELKTYRFPEVAIVNYRELGSGKTFHRMQRTKIIGGGPHVAATRFRDFSFVSGIVLDRALAQKHATAVWDGSEMYQMFIGSRIIAEGGRLLGIDDVIVLKDIQIAGELVDSYAQMPVLRERGIRERRLPLNKYGRVAFDAVAPFLEPQEKARVLRRILFQVLVFTYPPWLIEYRRVQSQNYAMGVALGMRSRNLLAGLDTDWWTRTYVNLLHVLVSTIGLLTPQAFYEFLRPRLYALAKRT